MNRMTDGTATGWKGLIVFALAALLLGCAASGESAADPDYDTNASYHLLMANIAFERSEFLVAAQEYLRAAEKSTDPELARRCGEYAFAYGFDAYALRCAQRWEDLEPDNPLAHSYLGRLYFRRDELKKSYQHYELVMGPAEERVDQDYLIVAADVGEDNNPRAAQALMWRFAHSYPDTPGAWLAAATAALQAGDTEAATTAASNALKLAPDWVQAEITMARIMMVAGDVNGSLVRMEVLLASEPSLGVELEYARLLAASGDEAAALAYIEELAVRYPERPELIRMRGLIRLQAGESDAAWIDFSRLLSMAYNINESFWYLGQIAFDDKRYAQALRLHGRIISGPYLVPAQLSIARAYVLLGQEESGLSHLQNFAEQYPKHSFDVLQPQARLLMQMDRPEEALAIFDLALVYKPNTESLLLARGSTLDSLGRIDEALRDLTQAVDVAPDSALALNALGYTLANRTTQYRKAYRYIDRALKLEPGNPAIIDSMGWVLFRRGRTDEALDYLERAYDMMPDPEVAAHLGEALWVQGNREQAARVWTTALELDPNSKVLIETVNRFDQ